MKWKVNDGCSVRFSRNAQAAVTYHSGDVFLADRHEITGLERYLTLVKTPAVETTDTSLEPEQDSGERKTRDEMETMLAEPAPETLEKPKRKGARR